MYIKSVVVRSHKSFRDSGVINFEPGFNIIVGKNNSGKTALLEALSWKQMISHMSLTGGKESPELEITFNLTHKDVLEVFRQINPNNEPVAFRVYPSAGVDYKDDANQLVNRLNTAIDVTIEIGKEPNESVFIGGFDRDNSVQRRDKGGPVRFIEFDSDGSLFRLWEEGKGGSKNLKDTADQDIANVVKHRIFRLNAERFNIDASEIKGTPDLLSDAANLPTVLNHLMTKDNDTFTEYLNKVKVVFEDIASIAVPVHGSKNAQIRILPHGAPTADFAIPLKQCGTGIGQVLAILYIAITSSKSQIILIDEPQSFLHPGAIRKLFDVLHELQQTSSIKHQYIITTHSPVVINAARPSTIHILKREGYESKVEAVDVGDEREARELLASVGARISDVFGADNILWVEGPTEETCFPMILETKGSARFLGTEIIGVVNTGDFSSKQAERSLNIYNKLSNRIGLMPEAVAFIFDSEGISETTKQDHFRTSNGQMRYLDRRMYENYLLHAQSIAEVMNSEGIVEDEIEASTIESWIEDNKKNVRFFTTSELKEINKSTEPDMWRSYVHGADMLDKLFHEFGKDGYSYKENKTTYAPLITKRILENKPDEFQEIADLLDEVLAKRQ